MLISLCSTSLWWMKMVFLEFCCFHSHSNYTLQVFITLAPILVWCCLTRPVASFDSVILNYSMQIQYKYPVNLNEIIILAQCVYRHESYKDVLLADWLCVDWQAGGWGYEWQISGQQLLSAVPSRPGHPSRDCQPLHLQQPQGNLYRTRTQQH